MPASNRSYTVETLKGQAVTRQLHHNVQDIQAGIGKRIYETALRGEMPNPQNLLSPQDMIVLKRSIYALRRDHLPSIVTHNMNNDATDPILGQLRRLGLYNSRDDRVKFLNSNNPVLPLEYEDFVRGCHLGVFPSYYEPWGYTPAECTVMGIPSITTNLSGFGCFIEDSVESPSDYGIYIVDRRLKSVDESIEQLAGYMFDFCCYTRRQRINLRNRTERLGDILDWKRMGLEYCKARHLVLKRRYPEQFAAYDEEDFHHGQEQKIPRPVSAPPSPRMDIKALEELQQ